MTMTTLTPPGSFLGSGWSFPPTFGPGGAELATAEELDKVHQSLLLLLATRPGERPLSDGFGCDLDALLFEEADHTALGQIAAKIRDAVLRHEPRVILGDIDVTPDAGDSSVLHVRLTYGVPGTNSRYNLVFPFYLNEARAPLG